MTRSSPSRQITIAIADRETVAGGAPAPSALTSPLKPANDHGRLSRRRDASWLNDAGSTNASMLRMCGSTGGCWIRRPICSLTCPARAILIEIARGHDGTNNGRLGLSIRRASERCNIARGTAQRALAELQERGFIDCMAKAHSAGRRRTLPNGV